MPSLRAHLPDSYAGLKITFRIPYTMPGELRVAAATANLQFADNAFLHNVDKPFECWGVRMLAAQLDANNNPIGDPAPDMDQWWRLNMRDLSKNEPMTKANSTGVRPMNRLSRAPTISRLSMSRPSSSVPSG